MPVNPEPAGHTAPELDDRVKLICPACRKLFTSKTHLVINGMTFTCVYCEAAFELSLVTLQPLKDSSDAE